MPFSKLSTAKILGSFEAILGGYVGGAAARTGAVAFAGGMIGGCIGSSAVQIKEPRAMGEFNLHVLRTACATATGFVGVSIFLILTTKDPDIRAKYLENTLTFVLGVAVTSLSSAAFTILGDKATAAISARWKKNSASSLSQQSLLAHTHVELKIEGNQSTLSQRVVAKQ